MSNFTYTGGAAPSLQNAAAAAPRPAPTQWYYRDRQGNQRGPYDDATMAAWFAAGYFPISVEVRRDCDRVFSRLSESLFPFTANMSVFGRIGSVLCELWLHS